ncbi:CBS domain-containing protein [Formivibrio citricus]|uniref:CBS domain-containing protein n=1 Tax=Formivibrio citricus TaxID=83765 RepID=A0A1I4XW45_9NEIS|nr:nucleotidyltransferase family protein [Formivibrio citricus]SFN29926.1 CBS domain-containing protein [Formivibrio citricus]
MNNPVFQGWHKTLLPDSATVEDAIVSLNQTSAQIVIVVDGAGRLVGTVTDGDVRRGLLRGLGVSSPLESIVFRSPLVVPPEMRQDSVVQLMKTNKVHQIPVVDDAGCVVGLHLWDEIVSPSNRSNVMVIMAGGLGTRLHPHTERCPKPLLPVAGRPMLELIIERARDNGFVHFILAIHYLGEMIEAYFGNGERWNVQIEYLRENSPLGTAGALGLLSPIPELPMVVTNGDVLTDIHYGELLDFHLRNRAAATMAVRLHEWQHPFGVVQTNGVEIVGFEEKPVYRSHVNAGVYVLDPFVLQYLDKDVRCDMPALFESVRAAGERAIVYPMHEPWLDVGRPGDYDKANQVYK